MAEITLTKDNFEKEIKESDKVVLIDFWATWCGPCKMIAPIIEEIAEEFSDEVKVCKVNIDDEPSLATKFGITSIPTLLVIKNGEVVKTSVGYIPKEKIIELFE
ncbi:MAG: thioredoxin [Oscillospiraceae bacterium]|nr:thioredoxin [Oscillospiraceae bacterium]